MRSLANSEDPDEMLKIDLQRKKYNFYLEIITCDPSKYTMGHSKLLYQTRRKNPSVHKELKAFELELCRQLI